MGFGADSSHLFLRKLRFFRIYRGSSEEIADIHNKIRGGQRGDGLGLGVGFDVLVFAHLRLAVDDEAAVGGSRQGAR